MKKIETALVAVVPSGEVLAYCEHFCHLVKAEVELVHFSVALPETLQQVVDLETDLLVLLVGACVTLQALYRLDVKHNLVCQLHYRLSNLEGEPSHYDAHAANENKDR